MNRLEEYLEIFKKMLTYETVSANDNDIAKFRNYHDLLKQLFPNLFDQCLVEDFNGSLLIKWKGKSNDNPIMFMNHHDVVPTSGDWEYPPFSATVVDNKIYSRGVLDTKGGLFSMLQAAEELIKEGFVPDNDIYFESACNEETSGAGAAEIGKALKERGIHFSYLIDEGGMIVDEPLSGVKGKYAMIGVGERNGAVLKFIAKSKGGHASTPGKNTPLVRLGKMMAYFDQHNVFDVYVNDTIVEMLKRFSANMSGLTAFIYKHADSFRPLLTLLMPKVSDVAKAMCQTTLAFTMAQASDASNVLPAQAYVIADMRLSHHQEFQSSLKAVKKAAEKFDIEVETIKQGTPSNIADYQSKGFRLAEKAVKEIFGNDCFTAPYIMNQCSDARSMAIVCENCLRFTPFYINQQQLSSIHGINENLDIDNLPKAVDFYKFMMKDGK